MATHLTGTLFTSHGSTWPAPDAMLRVRADHVLLDEDEGTAALLAFEAMALPRVRAELAIVVPGAQTQGPDARADHRYLQGAAAAFGAVFVRPGAGEPAAVHRRRFAAPGRVIVSASPGASGAGAFAMLALPGEAIELAAALAGEPLTRARPRVVGVRLEGRPRDGVGGHEVLGAIAEALGRAAHGAVVELLGAGLGALTMADRIGLAAHAPERLGALALVCPSDDRTRDYLRARGRDAEWRRLEGSGGGFDRELALDLGAIAAKGLVASARVRVGPHAEDDELAALAAAVEAGARADALDVVPGGRAARAALAATGVLERLAGAGAHVLDPASPEAATALAPGAVVCGEFEAAGERAFEPASIARIAMALGGERAASAAAAAPPVQGARLDPAELLDGEPGGAIERGEAHRVPVAGRPLADALRGVVVLCVPGALPGGEILGRGPRLHAIRADAEALASNAFRAVDEHAAGRARAHGGGIVACGGAFADAETREAPVRAIAALGIRVVIAERFGPFVARSLALHGVLPLRWRRGSDAAAVRPGDELELPALHEGLGRSGRLVVRDLGRGMQFEVEHALDEDAREAILAGGWIAHIARTAVAAETGATP